MEVSKEWLQVILEKNSNDSSISNILSIESEPVVGKGDNYCSIIFRIKITAILRNGKSSKRSVVIKRLPPPGKDSDIVHHFGFFGTERFVYSSLFPEMEQLMNDYEDTQGIHWARCLFSAASGEMIFEDLKAEGYASIPKGKTFNMAQTQVILWSMGRLHALSYILLQESKVSPDCLGSYIIGRKDDPVNQKFLQRGIFCTLSAIRSLWGPAWTDIANKLEGLQNDLLAKLNEACSFDGSRFNVLNQGDSWSSNILLKYSPVTGDPVHVKFVDFQMTHYNSYAFDLFYFLYSSVDETIREQEIDKALIKYREGLLATFSTYNYSPQHSVPSLEDIKGELDRLSLVSLITSCTVFPLTKCDPEESVNLSEAWAENEDVPKPYTSKNFTKFLQGVLRRYFN